MLKLCKNHILNIITLHPAAYQELNHDDSKIILNSHKSIWTKYPLSGFVDIKDIKIFSQKYTYAVNKNKNDENLSKNSYLELSKGELKIALKMKNYLRN